ncbi:MAG: DUF3473 domain-containing protein [Deltaproteobacteria bacterium]|nr:DUF3473 domain-containing protein [Deltaproteobacteria bacterium]
MLNAISVDVEEYFHVTNFSSHISRSDWPLCTSRLEESVSKTLDLFSMSNTIGSFFILGLVAELKPAIVKTISNAGHEIASHGHEHYLAYEQTPAAFRNDITHSKKLLEDICGREVIGYRAPSFSITEKNPWAHEIIVEAGYRYDSSVFPTWHPRYNNLDKDRFPTIIGTPAGKLVLCPLATAEVKVFNRTLRIPLAGGAYWRHLPLKFISYFLQRINQVEKMPFTCYFHPWELDDEQPVVEGVSYLTKVRHYGGIRTLNKKIGHLLTTFEFAPIRSVLQQAFASEHISLEL